MNHLLASRQKFLDWIKNPGVCRKDSIYTYIHVRIKHRYMYFLHLVLI